MKEFLERAAKAGALSYQDLHIILDALPVPVSWATLPQGEIRFVNRAFKKAFGYDDEEFATVADWIERAYPRPEDKVEARRRWQHLWQDRSGGIVEIDGFELKVRCKDQAIKTVQHRGILLHEMGIGIAVFNDISDRLIAEDALRKFASEDALTGLANRRTLQEEWDRTMRSYPASTHMVAVLLIDLDGFKAINDNFGHDVGDEALIVVARRLKESVRGGDLVCRIGGDEFAVLLPGLQNTETVEQICWRIGTALDLPFSAAGNILTVGSSIGASIYPQDGTGLQDLIKRSDEALYRRKAARQGGWEWFKAPQAA